MKSCILEMNNTQEDNVQDIDFMMSIYNLIGYSNSYSKISESLFLGI